MTVATRDDAPDARDIALAIAAAMDAAEAAGLDPEAVVAIARGLRDKRRRLADARLLARVGEVGLEAGLVAELDGRPGSEGTRPVAGATDAETASAALAMVVSAVQAIPGYRTALGAEVALAAACGVGGLGDLVDDGTGKGAARLVATLREAVAAGYVVVVPEGPHLGCGPLCPTPTGGGRGALARLAGAARAHGPGAVRGAADLLAGCDRGEVPGASLVLAALGLAP